MAHVLARNWWIGVGLGAAAGLGGLALAGATSEPANGQASSVTLSRQQLLINQRISQAAVRRGNEALDLLDPVRSSGGTDTAPGWGTSHLRDAAVIETKIADGAVSVAKLGPTAQSRLPLFAVVVGDGSLQRGIGTVASARTAEGAYKVTFNRDISACSWNVTVGAFSTNIPAAGTATASLDGDAARNSLDVRTYSLVAGGIGDPANRPFHAQVLCP
jgi:hypothetical protein